MSWLVKRRVKKWIENPEKYMVINPRFCEHVFNDNVCRFCGIKKETVVKYPYTIWQDAFDVKKENEIITYDKKSDRYGLDIN